jgi:hypothetical protein
MDAGSTKHSARLDDVMAGETPLISNVVIESAAAPLPGALGDDERRRRSELAIALRPSCFPAQREALILVAQDEVAPTWILELLEALPIETRFDTVQDVWEVAGGHREERDVVEPAPEPDGDAGDGPVAERASRESPDPGGSRPGAFDLALGVATAGVGLGLAAARTTISFGRRTVRAAIEAVRAVT